MLSRLSNRLIVGLFLLCLVWPGSLWADEPTAPQQVIQETSDRLHALLQVERKRLGRDPAYVMIKADELLGPRVDFFRVSSLVLGKHWRRATPPQRDAFSHEFKRLLVRTYATAFLDFDTWSLRFLPLHLEPGATEALVRTEVIHPGGPPVSVAYRVHKDDRGWKAYDVVIEGVSLVTNYRSSFAREVRRHGMDGLIRRITELNDRRERPGGEQAATAGSPSG
jgi:phospholipid transport system substrate-binding protein